MPVVRKSRKVGTEGVKVVMVAERTDDLPLPPSVQREHVPVLARAAVAAGVSGLFMETHPDPANAKSDGPNAWPLDRMESLLTTLLDLDRTVKQDGFEEMSL